MTTCKKCGNQIVWFKHNGKFIAVDAERVEVGDELYEPSRHGSHWGNCKKKPEAAPYVKPESFMSRPLTPEQVMASQYIRAIPEDEELRIAAAIDRRSVNET